MGISNKIDKIDMIFITEFGKKESRHKCFNIPGYKLYTALRAERKGGGLSIFVHNLYSSSIIRNEITGHYEILIIEITNEQIPPAKYAVVYRPPSANEKIFLSMIEALLSEESLDIIILGDMNINTRHNGFDLPICKRYSQSLDTIFMKVHNEAITRFNHATSNHSTIDHVVAATNNSIKVFTSTDSVTRPFSDHNLLTIVQPGIPNSTGKIQKKFIKKINKHAVLQSIKDKLTNYECEPCDSETQCSNLLDLIRKSHDENTRKLSVKTRNHHLI